MNRVFTLPCPPTASRAPVRIALAPPSGRGAFRRLKDRIGSRDDRVVLLGHHARQAADLVLVDPCTDGRELDLVGLGDELVGESPVVVYTAAPAVDPLAFAMAGSVMDGRLRGWLSVDLPAEALIDAIERIHDGDIVVEPPPV